MADVESQTSAAQHGGSNYRRYLPDLTTPRFTSMQKQDAHEYAREFKDKGQPPWLHALYIHWMALLKEPYIGVTNDGTVRDGLFDLEDEGVPVGRIADAANALLAGMDASQRAATCYHIDSPEWRTWSNPEFLLSDKGIRLDEITADLRDKVLAVLEETLSPEGYEKALGAMRINHFLGELVAAPAVLNEFSYNFVLFGDPSATRPWGFSFYGHHLCLSVFLYRSQLVVSPCFTGAEPSLVDDGPRKGLRILVAEEALGLRLMQSLPPEQQRRAQVYSLMKDPAMPRGRWNHDEQRHLCGAYRDNRVVPYEGTPVSSMSEASQSLVVAICAEYLVYLPATAREKRLALVRRWLHETHFCWIGGFGDADPFYYRIQSPVIIVEFDHHSGVFLTNTEPAKFHVHTLLRTPNGGDYGMALRPLIPRVQQEFVWEG